MKYDRITMAHGSGGADTAALVKDVFSKHFGNEVLLRMEDSAVITLPPLPRIAVSTDSFVVDPLVFPGGDIGKLAVCGTVNDVLMSGAEPRWLTCAFVIEAGLSISLLDNICASLAETAAEAGVTIIAGDTKVIEGRSESGGLIINTTGIGVINPCTIGRHKSTCRNEATGCDETTKTSEAPERDESTKRDEAPERSEAVGHDETAKGDEAPPAAHTLPSPSGMRPGDAIIVSGTLGEHHAAILSARMGIRNTIKSDCALLTPILRALRQEGVAVHSMRDITRGGLATVLNELAEASGVSVLLEESLIPVSPEVRAFCGLMGLDPLYMGNEGKLVLSVAPGDAERALACIQNTEIGQSAAIIGTASASSPESRPPAQASPPVAMRTRAGGTVRIGILYGEGLPRIC